MNERDGLSQLAEKKLPRVVADINSRESKVNRAWENVEYAESLVTSSIKDLLEKSGRKINFTPWWLYVTSIGCSGPRRIYINGSGKMQVEYGESEFGPIHCDRLVVEELNKNAFGGARIVRSLGNLTRTNIVERFDRTIR